MKAIINDILIIIIKEQIQDINVDVLDFDSLASKKLAENIFKWLTRLFKESGNFYQLMFLINNYSNNFIGFIYCVTYKICAVENDLLKDFITEICLKTNLNSNECLISKLLESDLVFWQSNILVLFLKYIFLII